MDSRILNFLECYKQLDELCKQVLVSDKGISSYIEQMEQEHQHYYVEGWDRDYKRLKNLRWKRNRLVHEVDAYSSYDITEDDIFWLSEFRERIMQQRDPFALLRNAGYVDDKNSKLNYYKINYNVLNFNRMNENSNGYINHLSYYDTKKKRTLSDFAENVIVVILIIVIILVLLGVALWI